MIIDKMLDADIGDKLGRVAAKIPAAAILGTGIAAEIWNRASNLGENEEGRLRGAAHKLLREAVGDFVISGGDDLWSRAQELTNEQREAGKVETGGVNGADERNLARLVTETIAKPYQIAREGEWSLAVRLPDGVSEKDKIDFEKAKKDSFDLVSAVNQKGPWRLFTNLNLHPEVEMQPTAGEKVKGGGERVVSFMSSRSVEGVFLPVTSKRLEEQREAGFEARKAIDACFVEAVLAEVASGVKEWDLAGAARSLGGLSPLEKLICEGDDGLFAKLVKKVATSTNRGYAWRVDGDRVKITDAVATSSQVAYQGRDGRVWIFDAGKDQGRVAGRLAVSTEPPSPREIAFRSIIEGNDEPGQVKEAIVKVYPSLGDKLSDERVLAMIADVRSVPTLLMHPERGIRADSPVEAMSKMRTALQGEVSRGRLNATIIMGEVDLASGRVNLASANDHGVRDGMEASRMMMRLEKRFREKMEEGYESLSSGAKDLVTNFRGMAKETFQGKDEEAFAVKPEDLRLGEVFPPKEKLSDQPGEEVTVAVEATHLWKLAKEVADEFKAYRDRAVPKEKTILVSPYFIMEMMFLGIQKELRKSEKVGVLVAQKGMRDLDLHPVEKGIDPLMIEKLLRGARDDTRKREELDLFLRGYMATTNGALAISNMRIIEQVASVAGPTLREGVNALSNLPGMKAGRESLAGDACISAIPPEEDEESVTYDGPAMDLAQKMATTFSGWIKMKGGRIAVMVAVKRKALQKGKAAERANQDAWQFANDLSTMIAGRERVLAARPNSNQRTSV